MVHHVAGMSEDVKKSRVFRALTTFRPVSTDPLPQILRFSSLTRYTNRRITNSAFKRTHGGISSPPHLVRFLGAKGTRTLVNKRWRHEFNHQSNSPQDLSLHSRLVHPDCDAQTFGGLQLFRITFDQRILLFPVQTVIECRSLVHRVLSKKLFPRHFRLIRAVRDVGQEDLVPPGPVRRDPLNPNTLCSSLQISLASGRTTKGDRTLLDGLADGLCPDANLELPAFVGP
mmetsp:Transcript_6697/g.21674  ORF Transcript_6697/g.21674 Transcript_6697/m.21674 type:complete len:229 (+) Transcript_6697:105-791(+)